MKKGLSLALIIFIVLFSALLSTCQGAQSTPILTGELPSPTSTEAPDDIVTTPGGYAYRANVYEQGVVNPWPPVHIDNIRLGSLNIYYRAAIETKAGETRNNLIDVYDEDGIFDTELTLYLLDVPEGITLVNAGSGGRPGMLQKVVTIESSSSISPSQYSFKIGIKLNDTDYGTIPCTINVIE